MLAAKQMGFSDAQIGHLTGQRDDTVRAVPRGPGRAPAGQDRGHLRRRVRQPHEPTTTSPMSAAAPPSSTEAARPRVVILSAGPNRIGQGIEFDYCCCHAVLCAGG